MFLPMMIRTVLFFALIGAVAATFDCVQITDEQIDSGSVTLPSGATEPSLLPTNFNCVYKIQAPYSPTGPKLYAEILVQNQLSGPNDLVTLTDGQGKRVFLSSRNNGFNHFYVFPSSTTLLQVTTKSVNMQSKLRVVITWKTMPDPDVSFVKASDPTMRYDFLEYLLVDVNYRKPALKIGDEPLVLTLAQSYWDADQLDHYFVVDGDFNNYQAVYHLSDFMDRPFVSTGNKLTVVGLGQRVPKASVIYTPISKAVYYDSMNGVTTYGERHSITLDAQNGLKDSLTVISRTNQTLIYDLKVLTPSESCSIVAVEVPASPTSAVLQDLQTLPNMPYMMQIKKFAVIVKNCAVTLSLVAPDQDD